MNLRYPPGNLAPCTEDVLTIDGRAGFSDCEASGIFPGNLTGISSDSSLSTRSMDSPSTSLEQVHPAASATNASTSWASDVNIEPSPSDWSQGISREVLACITNSEKKRQEIINELFHAERLHVRSLKVLSQVFHKPMLETQVLPLDQIQLIFSNLDEMLDIHSGFYQEMKKKKKENPCVGNIGDLLLGMFDGETGKAFERAASTYCAKQTIALKELRNRRRKDPKLNGFLKDVEANHLCRRMQLIEHLLLGMLRLFKYPQLLETLAKYTLASNKKEKAAVLRSLERSKKILSRVNQAMYDAESYHRLAEIQRTIDRTAFNKFDDPIVREFKNIDITKRKLIHEGHLQWRVDNCAEPIDLHVVLLDDTIFLLHRHDEKDMLNLIANQMNSMLSPIIRVSTVIVRANTMDRNSLYLINTSQNGAQIYELVASSETKCKLWYKRISEAAKAYNTRDREECRRTPPTMLPEEPVATNPDPEVSGERSDSEPTPKEPRYHPSESHQPQEQQRHNDSFSADGSIIACAQNSLVDPVEVRDEREVRHIAKSVLTPIERLRRKDEQIKQVLAKKQALVVDILNIPQEDFVHVGDVASESSETEKEPTELVLAAVNQANQLTTMLNSALTVIESETVLASLGSSASIGCPGPRAQHHLNQLSVSVSTLQLVSNSLTSQLSQLLEIVKQREEEWKTLRQELRRSREHLHSLDADAQRRESSNIPTVMTHNERQTDPGDSSNGESDSDDINEYISPADVFTVPSEELSRGNRVYENSIGDILRVGCTVEKKSGAYIHETILSDRVKVFVDAGTEPETNAEAEDVKIDKEV